VDVLPGRARRGGLAPVKIECAALLVDVDGTLVDSGAAVERSWRRWSAEYGADPERVLEMCHGRRSEDTIAELVGPAERPAAVALLKRLELTDLDGVVACPGAAELLAALDGRDALPWALVTSCGVELVTARMAAAGLPLPAVMITAERARHGKPDPECYRLGAEALGVPAADCAVLEDAPAGVASGRAAGAAVVAVTTTFPAGDLGDAHAVLESLTQVRPEPDGLVLAARP
jgi:sugar-phosphatase